MRRILLCRRRLPRGWFWEDLFWASHPPPLLLFQAFSESYFTVTLRNFCLCCIHPKVSWTSAPINGWISLNPCNFRSNYLSDAMWYVTTYNHMHLSNRMGGGFRLGDFCQPKNCKVLYSRGRYPVKVSACHDGDWSRLDCVGTLCGVVHNIHIVANVLISNHCQ